MNPKDFEKLLTSVRQAGRIRRGESRPSRVTTFEATDVRAIRDGLELTQEQFAMMIGVSVATLRNWEQGRRVPEGPAQALLRVAAVNPQAVVDALRR
jgi:putative transcriptional regulator